MTKEEIIGKGKEAWDFSHDRTVVVDRDDALAAMDEYAKQQGSAFVRWMDVDAIRNGENLWQWRGDNFRVDYTTEQLYDKFIEQQSKS